MSRQISPPSMRTEIWNTILSHEGRVWFAGMVQSRHLNFLVGARDKLISITVPRRSPFAVVDEAYTVDMRKNLPAGPNVTWKLWNSPLVQSLGTSVLFHGVPEDQKFSYFIVTEDECVEVISPEPKIGVLKTNEIGLALRELADR